MSIKRDSKANDLANELLYHRDLYYRGVPKISDEQFDALELELKKLNPSHPVLAMVGSFQKNDGKKVKHSQKMLSLDKCYEVKELLAWAKGAELIGMLKYDGSSCSLVYEDGKLVVAKTRGDGEQGEDITLKAISIASIPKTISKLGKIEIRGEVYCEEKQFKLLSERMKLEGLTAPTSQRNIVAGLLGRKEHTYLSQYLSFIAFDYLGAGEFNFETDKLNTLKLQNFSIPEYEICKTSDDVDALLERARELMGQGEVLVDGLVFIINCIKNQNELGVTNHHPRYKMAFKFQGDTATSKIESISWGVSRNGVCTPVANILPVQLSGATISRVTLHNFGQVKSFELKIGDEIEIVRSGEVIPKFLRVVSSNPNQKFSYPTTCPSCQCLLEIQDELWLVCNNDHCPEKKLQQLVYFVAQIGIDDLSEKRLQEMVKSGLVSEIGDLFGLTKEQILSLDKTKEKMANKLLENIQKAKENADLVTFLCALGLSGVSKNKIEKLIDRGFDTIEKFMEISLADILSIEGFAETSAKELISSMQSKRILVNKLISIGFKLKGHKRSIKGGQLAGLKFCITGTLSRKRSEIEEDIKSFQGIVVSSVNKETNYLITNETESNSSKFLNAKKYKTNIMSESELYQKLIKQN